MGVHGPILRLPVPAKRPTKTVLYWVSPHRLKHLQVQFLAEFMTRRFLLYPERLNAEKQ